MSLRGIRKFNQKEKLTKNKTKHKKMKMRKENENKFFAFYWIKKKKWDERKEKHTQPKKLILVSKKLY